MEKLNQIIQTCAAIAYDINYTYSKNWKSKSKDRVLVGHFPIYFPREIVWACNGLAIGILGGNDYKEVVKGDAYYQSYICHIPRSIIDLALDGHFNGIDGFVFSSICDVMRNLSGVFQIHNIGKFSKYLDYPQNFKKEIGGEFLKRELEDIIQKITAINGIRPDIKSLNNAIKLYNYNRSLLFEIYDIRQKYPWRLEAHELYTIIRAGLYMPVDEHNKILENVIEEIQKDRNQPVDKVRVIVWGAFCEQLPINLIKSIELAGCFVVDDDFLLGSRWILGKIEDNTDDPLGAIVEAYLQKSIFSTSVYDVNNPKEKRLVELAKKRNADGVIFVAPSFCDPALLDIPLCQKECEKNNIRFVFFQYSENTGQFKPIKEQIGAFADSIKLWEGVS
ncbi:MAG TPA: 2-hydroxyacyl-CoA dehydratase family protein [Bacteroidia bacterium]|nr:2-hydroxyacyl-CoA dehydratase family protein [Bacteroidia bacterium]